MQFNNSQVCSFVNLTNGPNRSYALRVSEKRDDASVSVVGLCDTQVENEMSSLKKWAIDTATVLFDDSKNDLRALPKTVRLQLLTVLSFVWSTAFTIYIWGMMRPDIWTGLVVGHIAILFASYYTFKQFHNVRKSTQFQFGSYHSLGRSRGVMIGHDKHGNPYKVELPNGDPGGEHE